VLILALKRTQPSGDRAQQARVLNLASIVVAVFIALQGWTFVDIAINAHALINPQFRKTADATLSAPAVTPASAP